MPYALLFRLEIGWSILYIEEMLVGLDLDRNNVPFFRFVTACIWPFIHS